jgi:hypothetical protein
MELMTTRPKEVAIQMFVLAFAAAKPVGMGFMQYDEGHELPQDKMMDDLNKEGKLYGDYVGGRQMKFGVEVTEDSVLTVHEFQEGYNSFHLVYPTPQDLFDAAVAVLNKQPTGEVKCK